jgi:hypothetical protein
MTGQHQCWIRTIALKRVLQGHDVVQCRRFFFARECLSHVPLNLLESL